MPDAYDLKTSEPELYEKIVKFVGGTGAVTKVFGKGATVTYISAGIVDVTFTDNPYTFVGLGGYGFEATTQAALKGYSVVAGAFNATTKTLRLNVTNNLDALTDLAALQSLTCRLLFKQTAV
ncbi:MAG: hypothetical protein H0V17_13080 [Deltaproteobacteria bacterium]|nr:hypothetical protein [Deltaproteobacteria bacterium]